MTFCKLKRAATKVAAFLSPQRFNYIKSAEDRSSSERRSYYV
nr:MAG TPA: hypothetical protein [Caudoviricetes sp.]